MTDSWRQRLEASAGWVGIGLNLIVWVVAAAWLARGMQDQSDATAKTATEMHEKMDFITGQLQHVSSVMDRVSDHLNEHDRRLLRLENLYDARPWDRGAQR